MLQFTDTGAAGDPGVDALKTVTKASNTGLVVVNTPRHLVWSKRCHAEEEDILSTAFAIKTNHVIVSLMFIYVPVGFQSLKLSIPDLKIFKCT